MRVAALCSLAAAAASAAAAPPCFSPLNPALETICSTIVASDGIFSIRDFGNATLVVSANAAPYGNWAEDSQVATQELLYYFGGANAAFKKVDRTVPLIYKPLTDAFGRSELIAAMALPASLFPTPASAPAPDAYDVLTPFPAQRFAAAAFNTTQPATDLEYTFACGEAAQWLSGRGVAPTATQLWVTYSGRDASLHASECWLGIATQ